MSETPSVKPIAPMSVPTGTPGGGDGDMDSMRLMSLERAVSSWFPYYVDVDTHRGTRRLLTIGLPTNDVVRPHDWKISLERGLDPNGPRNSWDVLGGTVFSLIDGTSISVPDANVGSGIIYLKLTRNPDSRKLISAVIESSASIPSSDYHLQYIPLGNIVDGRPVQYAFEQIRIHELLIVANGEFKLTNLQAACQKSYDPPSS